MGVEIRMGSRGKERSYKEEGSSGKDGRLESSREARV